MVTNRSRRKTGDKVLDNNMFSSFWMAGTDVDWYRGEGESPFETAAKLLRILRSVSNFVRICNRSSRKIHTRFNSGGQSYARMGKGKDMGTYEIVIDANWAKEGQIDPTVGQALHEVQHINNPAFFAIAEEIVDHTERMLSKPEFKELVKKGTFDTTNLAEKEKLGLLAKTIANLFEDRRIEYQLCERSPGYRGYIDALHDVFFQSKEASKGLRSPEYRKETLESYLFHLIHMTNADFDPKALEILPEIYHIASVAHLIALKDEHASYELARKVVVMLIRHLGWEHVQEQMNSPDSYSFVDVEISDEEEDGSSSTTMEIEGDNNEKESGASGFGGKGEEDPADESEEGGNKKKDSNDQGGEKNAGSGKGKKITKLPTKLKEKLREALEKELNRINDEQDKGEVTNQVAEQLEEMEKGDYSQKGIDIDGSTGLIPRKVDINKVKVRNLPDEQLPYGREQFASRAKVLGRQLRNKLRFRENKSHEFRRRRHGRVDRTLLHEHRAGNEKIFSRTINEEYPDITFILSIDGSGSMNGYEIDESTVVAAAVAYACETLPGIEVIVNVRQHESSHSEKDIWVRTYYDSRNPKSKIKNIFHILATGYTPEGIAFAGMIPDLPIPDTKGNSHVVFVNLADGEPYLPGKDYSGYPARRHTFQQFKKIRAMGIRTVTFGIGVGDYNPKFDEAYGSQYWSDIADGRIVAVLTKWFNKILMSK